MDLLGVFGCCVVSQKIESLQSQRTLTRCDWRETVLEPVDGSLKGVLLNILMSVERNPIELVEGGGRSPRSLSEQAVGNAGVVLPVCKPEVNVVVEGFLPSPGKKVLLVDSPAGHVGWCWWREQVVVTES
jgi:hypothetical protein